MKPFILIFASMLIITSCSRSSEKSPPTNQEEIQSKKGGNGHGGGGSGSGGGVDNSIPAPTGLTAVLTAEKTVQLNWNPVPNATTYWIRRDSYVPAIITGTSYIDRSVSIGNTYTYSIAAVVNSVLGPNSIPVSITVQ